MRRVHHGRARGSMGGPAAAPGVRLSVVHSVSLSGSLVRLVPFPLFSSFFFHSGCLFLVASGYDHVGTCFCVHKILAWMMCCTYLGMPFLHFLLAWILLGCTRTNSCQNLIGKTNYCQNLIGKNKMVSDRISKNSFLIARTTSFSYGVILKYPKEWKPHRRAAFYLHEHGAAPFTRLDQQVSASRCALPMCKTPAEKRKKKVALRRANSERKSKRALGSLVSFVPCPSIPGQTERNKRRRRSLFCLKPDWSLARRAVRGKRRRSRVRQCTGSDSDLNGTCSAPHRRSTRASRLVPGQRNGRIQRKV